MREALTLACIACAMASLSCGFEKGGLGPTAAFDPSADADTSGADADPPGADADPSGADADPSGADAAADAPAPTAPHGDPYPKGAIAFFKRDACPPEWTPYEPAVGRTLLPTVGGTPPGGVNGAPLESGEDRTHTHKWSTAFSVGAVSFATFDGSNDGVARAGTVPFAGTTEPASSGVPYAQLLVCKKVGARGPRALPRGAQVFFDGATCPDGYRQTEETQGRVLVGLPKGAGADQTFGKAPMSGLARRTHGHALDATLATDGHGLAVLTGCCRDGYARDGRYAAKATSDEASAALPWLELLSCSKD
jgi:hypothetical protein